MLEPARHSAISACCACGGGQVSHIDGILVAPYAMQSESEYYRSFIGIVEKKMENIIVYRDYIEVI